MNFARAKKDDLQLNITPLIDIVFLLLIFFMVTTSFEKTSPIEVSLPKTNQQLSDERKKEWLEVVIDESGQYYVDDKPLANSSLTSLKAALQSLPQFDINLPLVIRADGQTSHQAVVTAMEAASQLGIKALKVATEHSNPTS